MTNESDPNIREALFVDLVCWLEKTGQEGKTANIARRLFEGESSTCQSFAYHFEKIESDGVLEVRFYFPFSHLAGIIDIEKDMPEFKKWLSAVNDRDVTIDIGSHKKLGDCIVVHRFHYIPEEHRDKWIGSKVVAVEEQGMLCKLLNRRKPQE